MQEIDGAGDDDELEKVGVLLLEDKDISRSGLLEVEINKGITAEDLVEVLVITDESAVPDDWTSKAMLLEAGGWDKHL